MSFADWSDEELKPVREGLSILGWRPDIRLTSQDAVFVRDLALTALELRDAGQLTAEEADRLAWQAYRHVVPQIMGAEERAWMATGPYSKSKHLKESIRLIDQATLAIRNGLYTAASALLYITLERYLRSLAQWQPGQHVTFPQLRDAVLNFRSSTARDEVHALVSRIYEYYDAQDPPDFFLNRHGLLHGFRPDLDVDRLNCARLFLVLDRLCAAEEVMWSVEEMDKLHRRAEIYAAGKMDEQSAAFLYDKA